MFGSYDIPFRIEEEGVTLSVDREGEELLYTREYLGEKVAKMLLTRDGQILINPVEPVNRPKEITSYLLIELDPAVVVEPNATRKIIATFPVEIGIFISGNKDFEPLDVLTLAKQRFTLYGDPRSGVICKYWKSTVVHSIPSLNPLREGVIEVNITNTTNRWAELTKAIFNAYGMKIYYSDELVAMKANMKIAGKETAETDFVDVPLKEGMEKSLELYTARKLIVTTTKFVMEAGL